MDPALLPDCVVAYVYSPEWHPKVLFVPKCYRVLLFSEDVPIDASFVFGEW